MKRVTGIGGIFFKAANPEELQAWYQKHLDFPLDQSGVIVFQWRDKDNPEQPGNTIWAPFASDTTYFDPSTAPFMFNYRVEDLDQTLALLREEGVRVEDRVEESEFGRFGWIFDPEGNKIELWEPPEGR